MLYVYNQTEQKQKQNTIFGAYIPSSLSILNILKHDTGKEECKETF